MSNFILKVFLWLLFSFGLDNISTKLQGLSGKDCNFQGLSRSVRTLDDDDDANNYNNN